MHTRDIMSHPVHTVLTDDSIEHAAALLTEKKITAVPVLDNAGKLVGMVSEGDLLRDRVPPPTSPHIRGVAPTMTSAAGRSASPR